MTQTFARREFLRDSGLLGMSLATTGLAAPHVARAATTQLTIVSNPGLENATLNELMHQQGYFRRFGANARLVLARGGASGPFDAIVAGVADVCMVSGYDLVLSRIEGGARLKIVGAGMRKCALAVYAKPGGIRSLSDLYGRTIAVGPVKGLLHVLMLQLLKEKGMDAARMHFVDKGSNDQCYRAVLRGEADVCCSSISHLDDKNGLVPISGGDMWRALPRYTFQTAYASDSSIQRKHHSLVAVMAAYGALYEFLMSPDGRPAFFEARRQVRKKFQQESARAVWNFNQQQHPYSKDLTMTESDIGYLQDVYLGLGMLRHKQPFVAVADMSAAMAAAKLIR